MSADKSQALSGPGPEDFSPQWWRAHHDRLEGRVVRGMYPAQVRERFDKLRELHREDGTILLVFDAAQGPPGGAVLERLAESYFTQVSRQATPSTPAVRLAETLFGRTRLAGERPAGVDAPAHAGRDELVARLWTLLARQIPATLVVLHPDFLGEDAADRLGSFLSRIFADPIASLAPELMPQLDGGARTGGTVVFVGEPDSVGIDTGALGFETVDAAATAPAELRAYLAQADVLTRLVHSTGGSLPRLRALLDDLPDNVEDLLLHRYEQLARDERDLLDLLAVAGQAVPADGLDAGAAEALLDRGFIHRRVDGTRLSLLIDEPSFSQKLVERLEPQRLQALTGRLAELFCAAGDDEACARFRLRADGTRRDVERAIEVASGLVDQGEAGRARWLLEEARTAVLANHAHTEQARAVLRLLVDVERAEDNHRQALVRCEELAEQWGARVPADVELLRAELFLTTGEHDAARRGFERALQMVEEAGIDALRARFGLAEAAYLGGQHGSAHELADQLVADVDTHAELDDAARSAWSLRAHNLLGKLAIYAQDYLAARRHFEQVRDLAQATRAQAAGCRAQANLGIVAMQLGELQPAAAYLEAAAASASKVVGVDRGGILLNLGMLHQGEGRFQEAFPAYTEALESASRAGNSAVYYTAAYNLATLYQDVGALERALQALAHLEREPYGPRPLRIAAYGAAARAGIYFEQGRYREALGIMQRARERFADVESLAFHGPKEQLQAALAHLELDEVDDARDLLARVDATGSARVEGLARLVRAHLAGRDGHTLQARRLAREAFEQLDEAGYHHGRCRAALLLATLFEEAARLDDAVDVLDEAIGLVHLRAESVPDAFRDAYFAQPLHHELFSRARRLRPGASADGLDAGVLPSSRVLAIAHEILEGQTSLREQQRRLEHECIRAALERTDGNITQAAELLQLNRSRLSQIINADSELSSLKQRLKG